MISFNQRIPKSQEKEMSQLTSIVLRKVGERKAVRSAIATSLMWSGVISVLRVEVEPDIPLFVFTFLTT